MGYTTDFSGQLKITPTLKPEHEAYLRAFASTRRMQRNAEKTKSLPDPVREAAGLPVGVEGGYYVGSPRNYGQDATPDVVDYNKPPAGQPGLWCQWTIGDHPPETTGDELEWDGGEKFYEYVEWLEYLVTHFYKPWGYSLTGQIMWQGENPEDVGCIDARGNGTTGTDTTHAFNPSPQTRSGQTGCGGWIVQPSMRAHGVRWRIHDHHNRNARVPGRARRKAAHLHLGLRIRPGRPPPRRRPRGVAGKIRHPA